MKLWWRRRSLRVRLTLWFATTAVVILFAFGTLLWLVLQRRLGAEIDRQLRIDFDLVAYQLERDADGAVHWNLRGSHGDDGELRAATWFEVWSESGTPLLRRWPIEEEKIGTGLPAPEGKTLRFYSTELEEDLHVRIMERPSRIGQEPVVVRVVRAEAESRRTLAEIATLFLAGVPFVVGLSAVGGYFIARRSLLPIRAMAERAREITADSLGERLPVPNPDDELGELATVFNDTLNRLENSFAELKRFTADASHELRTPLTALRTVGEVGLRPGDDSAVLRETIGSMLEEAHRLGDLVDGLLLLARADNRGVKVHRENLAVSDLLGEVRESLQILADEKRQRLEVGGQPGINVYADRLLLRQAIFNLVHNAIRHSPPETAIVLRVQRTSGSVVIECADEGPGIAPEHRAKIFERFYRVDNARSRDEGGAGLGLAIAKWSVEIQGGNISIENSGSAGSVFRITLPVGPLGHLK